MVPRLLKDQQQTGHSRVTPHLATNDVCEAVLQACKVTDLLDFLAASFSQQFVHHRFDAHAHHYDLKRGL